MGSIQTPFESGCSVLRWKRHQPQQGDGEVLSSAASTAASVQHEIEVTEYGQLLTQNRHKQKDNHAGSASLVSCHQKWLAADEWGGGYRHRDCTATLGQNSPLLLKNLQFRDILNETHGLSSLALNVLFFLEFIQSPSLCTVSTPTASCGREFQRFVLCWV